MLTFRNYIASRPTNINTVYAAAALALKVADPEKYILDFAESHYPQIYPELVMTLCEAAPPVATPAGDAAAGGGAVDPKVAPKDAGDHDPQERTSIGDIISNIASWFTGGGAQRNFNNAITALKKVKGVFDTVKVPEELLANDERFQGYDDFVKQLGAGMEQLQKSNDAPALAGMIDALKANPEKRQVNQDKVGEDDGEAQHLRDAQAHERIDHRVLLEWRAAGPVRAAAPGACSGGYPDSEPRFIAGDARHHQAVAGERLVRQGHSLGRDAGSRGELREQGHRGRLDGQIVHGARLVPDDARRQRSASGRAAGHRRDR